MIRRNDSACGPV
jgi:hypothetical protein